MKIIESLYRRHELTLAPKEVTYEEIREEYLSSPSLHPSFTAVLPIEGLDGKAFYNPFAHIDQYGKLQIMFRTEPDDPEREDSEVRRAVWRGDRFMLTDFKVKKGSKVYSQPVLKDAQDPHLSPLDSQLRGVGYVKIKCEDGERPGRVTQFYEEIIPMDQRGVLVVDKVIKGRLNEKDVRPTYVGNRQRLVGARERVDDDGSISSYLQAKLLPVEGDITSQIDIVRESPESAILTLVPNKKLWYGFNHHVVLERTNGVVPIGSFEHLGTWDSLKTRREYPGLANEYEFSGDTGEIVASSTPKIIVMASDFKEDIRPKKPDLEDVIFLGNAIFVPYDNGKMAYAMIFVGVKDQVCGMAVIEYPFSLPPDRRLNKDYIWNYRDARQFRLALEKSKTV